jgi:indolepyruvate ferredoxin oxidoreductase beta subunit
MHQQPARSPSTLDHAPPTNVLVVGVGGQGVLLVSKVLARLCQANGFTVKQSEVHGMAKRGGVVFSHVRFGAKVWSPTIPAGEADVLLALEWAEGIRWLPHLKPHDGTFIADTRRLVPPFACRDRRPGASSGYVTDTAAEILSRVDTGYALDATGMAGELGNPRAANTVLLGVLSSVLDFPEEQWLDTLTDLVPAKSQAINRDAFLEGRAWAESPTIPPPEPARSEAVKPQSVTLEITAAWCKSCDICVKMCPERCLRLDHRQIVELKDPDACTGCRICEMLCPDFAITVHMA